MTKRTAQMLRIDLEAQRIAAETALEMSKLSAHLWSTAMDVLGSGETDSDMERLSNSQSSINTSPGENTSVPKLGRVVTGPDGESAAENSNSGWRFCRPLPKSPRYRLNNDLQPFEPAGLQASPLACVSTDTSSLSNDLAVVMAAWPELPEAIKAGILAMVRAASSKRVKR